MTRLPYGEVKEGAENSIGFYLSNNFSLLPFASAIEPLRIANRLSRQPLYQWSVITAQGGPVYATNGLKFEADHSIETVGAIDMLFVSGPHEPAQFDHKPSIEWLQKLSKGVHKPHLIGGIETGSLILAQAGLLKGIHCTTHWENIGEFRALYPDHKISTDLYEVSNKYVTCSGGSASLDMMLYIIEQHYGHELAASVGDVMIHPSMRHAGEPQRMKTEERIGINHPILVDCVELMEANVEQPLSPQELASLVGVSKRQLERLFRRYLHTTPARYYLSIRLESARVMLEKTTMKIIDVALACGFKSAGHFSSRYVSSFGKTPRETRNT